MVMLLILLTSGFDYMESPIVKKIPKVNILTSARISTGLDTNIRLTQLCLRKAKQQSPWHGLASHDLTHPPGGPIL